MNIVPFCPTLPVKPSSTFFQNLRKTPGTDLGWKGFKTYQKPALGIYHIQTPQESYHGIIALTATKDFRQAKVLPHEKTLVKKEKATLLRLQENGGMYKPILLTYKPSKSIDHSTRLIAIENRPDYIYEDVETQSRHLIWLVTNELQQIQLKKQFSKISYCFLADGHHRAKSILRWPQSKDAPKHILTAYFDLDEVRVSPYNRVILEGRGMIADLEANLKKYVRIIGYERRPPQQKGTFLIILKEKSILCRWRKSILKKTAKKNPQRLDTYLLNEYLLKKMLGLKKIRSNKSIAYIEGQGGVSKTVKKVHEHKDHIGFCLFPILEKDFVTSSKKSIMLPPKSTWFRPRLTGGLICQRFT